MIDGKLAWSETQIGNQAMGLGKPHPRRVTRILLRCRSPKGYPIALVECDDGSFGITSKDELLAEHVYSKDQIEECIDVFLRLCGRGAYAGRSSHTS